MIKGSANSRKELPVFFVLLAALLLSSCANRGQSPADTLTTIVVTPVQSLNPLYGTDANSQHINELTHASLMAINDELVPAPYLAEEFKVIDPLTMEFRLRAGCRFASGRALTADDVKKSLDYFQDPANQSAFLTAFEPIKKFEKIDDLRFRLVTDKPAPGLTADLDLLKVLDLEGVAPGARPSIIPGAGPYSVTRLDASQINLERFDQPCLPRPPMKKIAIKVVRDDLSRYLKIKTGEIDIVLNEMNYRKVEVIAADPTLPIKVIHSPGIGYTYLGLNMASEKLADPRVRRALALSFDVPSLIRYKSRGMATPARNLLADQNYYANLSVPVVERNLAEARRLLGEAGYNDGSNGKPSLRLSFKTNTSPISIENARVLVAQAREAGIELELQSNDWGIFYDDVKTGNTEVYLLRWVGVTDPRIYAESFHSKEIGRGNRTRYRNPRVDALLDEAETTIQPEKRRALYLKVQEIVAQDLPYVGLWYGNNVAVFRENVKNVKLHTSGKWINLLSTRKE